MSKNSEDEYSKLVLALKSNQPALRWQAANALGESRLVPDNATEELIRCLKDETSAVREAASHALYSIGSCPESSLPNLLESLTDESDFVRVQILKLLLKSPPSFDLIKYRIRDLYGSSNLHIRVLCIQLLLRMETVQDDFSETLSKGLVAKEGVIRADTLRTISEMGPAALEFLPLLEPFATDSSLPVRLCFLYCMERLRVDSTQIRLTLEKMRSEDVDASVRSLAGHVLFALHGQH